MPPKDYPEPLATLGSSLQALFESIERIVNAIDWPRLDAFLVRIAELPKKSKDAMALAASKGWYFGWHGSLPELMDLIDELAATGTPVDAVMEQYYRDNLQPFTDELVQKYPHRSQPIKAAVNAHRNHEPEGYFLSIPVFIAQADGLLTEITKVQSAMRRIHKTSELHASKALRDKLSADPEALDLIYPLLTLPTSDFLKSENDRKRSVELSGQTFAALNRHLVMHGESSDYGTETNSLKAFSFLAFIGLHLPMIMDTTAGP